MVGFYRPNLLLVALAILGLAGCSDMIRVTGQVTKGGSPYMPGAGEVVQVVLCPFVENESPADVFPANVSRRNSTFRVPGKSGTGIRPGKYRIAVIHKKGDSDLLKGAFSMESSPIVREISTSENIVIDLEKPTG